MSKLGLIIKVTGQGETEGFSVNKNTWSRYASDARSIINVLTGFDKTGKRCVFVKFLGSEGLLLGAVIANPANTGRDFDNTTAWIHVPIDAAISGAELVDVVNQVFSAFGELNTDTGKLTEIFSRDYPPRTYMPALASIQSAGQQTAIVYYGTNYSFPELLGDYLAQPVYGNYKAIVFADQSQGVSCPNVINTPFKKCCKISISPSNDGFVPYINGVPVKGEIEVCEGPLSITWKRQGFKDVQKVYPINQSNSLPGLAPSDYRRTIDLAKLNVYEKGGGKIKTIDSIRVNGMKTGTQFDISEDEYRTKGLLIEITKNCFEAFSKHFRTVEELYAETIWMKRRMNEYNFILKINARDAQVNVVTSERLTDSPFKSCKALGTVMPNKQIRLEQSQSDALGGWLNAKTIVSFIAGIILALLGVFAYNAISGLFNQETEKGQQTTDNINAIEKDVEASNTIADTEGSDSEDSGTKVDPFDNYLNNCEGVVQKDSLEKYAKGLYDAMNKFDKKTILDYASKVDNEKFKEIANYMEKNFEPKKGTTFHGNKDNGSINLNMYLKNIKTKRFNALLDGKKKLTTQTTTPGGGGKTGGETESKEEKDKNKSGIKDLD